MPYLTLTLEKTKQLFLSFPPIVKEESERFHWVSISMSSCLIPLRLLLS